MMGDIFSSFDDHNGVFMSYYLLMWTVSLLFVSNLNMTYWAGPGRWLQVGGLLNSVVFQQVTRSLGFRLGGFVSFVSSLFSLIIFMNLVSLVPYVFSVTSHLVTTFSFGLPFWMSLIISSFFYNLIGSVAGLLPAGAPAVLNPFLVLVETVSIFMRPCTLSIRLTANMSAGHIVLGLIGVYLMGSVVGSGGLSFLSLLMLLFVQIGYFMFEFGVSLIQAYIFSLLVTLYANEHA
uniref:ATP synthase subunit a n=1 Tax=Diodora graeca TaxID=120387 RepID=A0A0X9TLK8_DIOGA|nr:ATP synthase F0 subunit 6 [Diodora graeca]